MKCLVTGAAGFIGSSLCNRLLGDGHEVTGIDCFIDYYARAMKEANLAASRRHSGFTFHEIDLRIDPLGPLLEGTQVVFHLAAMPGLPNSWTQFDLYNSCNLTATQRLLDAAQKSSQLERFVYASTSSVYGRFSSGDESLPLKPISPYGVTKLAAERLCFAYWEEFSIPVVALRYFSVYGPGQRPDMAYHRFIQALLNDQPVIIYGDGKQIRSNTFVEDCVEATLRAIKSEPGEVFNIGGAETATLLEVLGQLEGITKLRARLDWRPARNGDQRVTSADTRRIALRLGWVPSTPLAEGLARQVEWQRSLSEGRG